MLLAFCFKISRRSFTVTFKLLLIFMGDVMIQVFLRSDLRDLSLREKNWVRLRGCILLRVKVFRLLSWHSRMFLFICVIVRITGRWWWCIYPRSTSPRSLILQTKCHLVSSRDWSYSTRLGCLRLEQEWASSDSSRSFSRQRPREWLFSEVLELLVVIVDCGFPLVYQVVHYLLQFASSCLGAIETKESNLIIYI